MRIPRIFHPELLTAGSEIALCDEAANHVGRVLRMGAGQALELFDGSNLTFAAEIVQADKKASAFPSAKAAKIAVNPRFTCI